MDSVAEGKDTVGVEWHVEVGDSKFPLGRGLTQAKIDVSMCVHASVRMRVCIKLVCAGECAHACVRMRVSVYACVCCVQ